MPLIWHTLPLLLLSCRKTKMAPWSRCTWANWSEPWYQAGLRSVISQWVSGSPVGFCWVLFALPRYIPRVALRRHSWCGCDPRGKFLSRNQRLTKLHSLTEEWMKWMGYDGMDAILETHLGWGHRHIGQGSHCISLAQKVGLLIWLRWRYWNPG